MLPVDVEKYIVHRFAPAECEDAIAMLASATLHDGSAPGPRLLRCAAVASGGSMERLQMEVETLRRDYRDVIVEGEYIARGRELVKVRNLLEPIPDDT